MRFAVLGLILLAGCGADGAPFRPSASGGLTIGTGGVSANSNVNVTNGALTLGLSQSVSR